MRQRDAWGNQAAKVDARVEEEWDSIYVDCQESADVDFQDFSFDDSGDLLGSRFGSTSANGEVGGSAMGRNAGGVTTAAAANSRREAGLWRASSSRSSSSAVVSTGGSRSALMSAMDAYEAEEEGEEEEEEDGEESGEEGEGGSENKGFDEEDIIDCAIRGRWTFKNNDDPVRRTPNPAPMRATLSCRKSFFASS